MAFRRGRNCYLVIKHQGNTLYPTSGKLEALVDSATGLKSIRDYQPYSFASEGADPTDIILFDVPRSASALEPVDGDEYIVTGASPQRNGTYIQQGRATATEPPRGSLSIMYVVSVRKQTDNA